MSLISKNFFFTFFNLFVVFTIFGTAANVYEARDQLGEQLKDLPGVTRILAAAVSQLTPFYMNLIVLQGLGLFPFRLLMFGAVSMYPIYLFGAKTPRGISSTVAFLESIANRMYRLCRARSAPNVQLRLLSAPNPFHIHNLHSVQYSSEIRARDTLWIDIFYYWKFCIQISAPLCHGPPTTLNRKSLVHNLQSSDCGPCCLPAHYGWAACASYGNQALSTSGSPAYQYGLVWLLLPSYLQPIDELYCLTKPQRR